VVSIFATPYETPSRENPADDIDEILKIVEENERLKNPEVLWPGDVSDFEKIDTLGTNLKAFRELYETELRMSPLLPMPKPEPIDSHRSDAWRYAFGMGVQVRLPNSMMSILGA